jgi:hypothetical protein
MASREFNTAEANRELQCGDGWLCDHSKYDRELAAEIDALLKAAMPAGLDAHGLAEAHGKLNPDLGMPELRGNVETGDLHNCPCPACGRMLVDLWSEGDRMHAGHEFHCEYCHARLRVEYATVTLSEEAGRRK